jgi:hypothetical protein
MLEHMTDVFAWLKVESWRSLWPSENLHFWLVVLKECVSVPASDINPVCIFNADTDPVAETSSHHTCHSSSPFSVKLQTA